MRRNLLVLVVCLGVASLTGGAWAQSDSITISVSLATEIAVTVTPNNFALGAISSLPATLGPVSATATVGNTTTQLRIKSSHALGGWMLAGAAGQDQFKVTVDSPALTLTTSDQTLDAGVAPYGSKGFDLTYDSPTSDTKGGGVDQSFSVTVTASAP